MSKTPDSDPKNADNSNVDVNERIRQLGRRRVLELPQMVEFHTWLDGKRLGPTILPRDWGIPHGQNREL